LLSRSRSREWPAVTCVAGGWIATGDQVRRRRTPHTSRETCRRSRRASSLTKADTVRRDGRFRRQVFRRWKTSGLAARVGRWYLRRGSRRGRKRGPPRYSEWAALPDTRVPRRQRKVEILTGAAGGVFDGLNKQEMQKVATRSAKRTRTPAAWRSEPFGRLMAEPPRGRCAAAASPERHLGRARQQHPYSGGRP